MDSVNLSIIYRIHLQQILAEYWKDTRQKLPVIQGTLPAVEMHCLLWWILLDKVNEEKSQTGFSHLYMSQADALLHAG